MRPITFVAVLLAAVSYAGCAATLDHPHHTLASTASPDGVQHVTITTHSFWYEPDRVEVKAGVPVELRLSNGSMIVPHNMTCLAPDAGITIDRGVGLLHGGATLRFTPTTPGTYQFFCDKSGHAKKGMTGEIVVTR